MATFSDFDTRGYRMVDARTGYGEWVTTYEGTVEDAMDIALLERLKTPRWETVREAADLGCGTGRTGAWLRAHGVGAIDGVDLTPEMLERARARGAHRTLVEADVAATGLETAAYDLAITSLVDEHLATLDPLYSEAFRVVKPGGQYVLRGVPPALHHGVRDADPLQERGRRGCRDHDAPAPRQRPCTAALGAGWTLVEMHERLIDDDWVTLKPKWERYRNHPISAVYVWQK